MTHAKIVLTIVGLTALALLATVQPGGEADRHWE